MPTIPGLFSALMGVRFASSLLGDAVVAMLGQWRVGRIPACRAAEQYAGPWLYAFLMACANTLAFVGLLALIWLPLLIGLLGVIVVAGTLPLRAAETRAVAIAAETLG